MARDDGEFELILGNKQLLSVLFIIIVLLGVFFAMGFLAGRSTGPKEVAAVKSTEGKTPLILELGTKEPGQPEPLKPAPAGEPAMKDEPKRIEPAGPEPAKPEPAKKEPPKAEEKKPEAKKAEAPKEVAVVKPAPPTPAAKSAPPPAPAVKGGGRFVASPPAGTYLQVAATRRPDGEAMLGMLIGKGCPGGYLTPPPKAPELVRVILGPLSDTGAIAAARECIKKVGLETAVVIKY